MKWITLISLVALAALSAVTAASRLTNEEIVRMTSAEIPEPEILRAIREADQVEFDLSADVVSEMRLVGVTAVVINAMKERTAGSATPGAATSPDEGTIEIVFAQEDSPEAKKRPGLPLPRAALFLFCVEPTHVPDYWTTKTPLAQKFPRHHLLWFHEPPLMAADAGKEKHEQHKRLPLPVPARVTVPAGEHPIEAGIAVWAPDQTWIPIAVASRRLNIVAGQTVRLVVSVAVHKLPAKEPVTVEIVEPPAAPAPSAGQSPAP